MKSFTSLTIALGLFSLFATLPTVSGGGPRPVSGAVPEQPAGEPPAATPAVRTIPTPEFNRENPLVLAVRKVKPSIISLKVERKSQWGKKEGIGTGVIIDERGYAITNRHVAGGASKIQVALPDKTEVNAQLVFEDPINDLAILKLPAGKYQPLVLGPGSDLMEGETVIAIGHPYGLTNTVSTGIISALGREIDLGANTHLTNLIQHTACINPGNSGGPLVNINGELIGINVALREGAQAIGFALNSETVKRVLSRHLSAAKVSQVQHGLTCSETVQPHGPNRQNVVVDKVAGNSPAAAAGLQSGDVILKLGDQAISNRFDVERAFWSYKAGDQVQATVLRAGQPTSVALTLPRSSGIIAASTGTEAPAMLQVSADRR
jgi:serine protease Do